MRKKNKVLICQIIASLFVLVFLCEYLIYYIVILQCSWPELEEGNADDSISIEQEENAKAVRALFLADIHLLGLINGHWFDKLRREWQMHRAFHTAVSLFDPEVVFILGDLFDQGLRCGDREFEYYVKRLHFLFQVKENRKIYYVVGNHDIGFHYDVTEHLLKRFTKTFNAPPVQLVSVRGNHFVLINSMAMEGDGCFLCRPAQLELNRIAKRLRCAKGIGKCPPSSTIYQYSRPILLQHFPMYRESDKNCFEPDEAPEDEKKLDFHEGWNCLSKEASEMIYDFLQPRLIVGAHTHHGCHVVHRKDIHEYTLPSFNWRNKNNPNFLMGVFSPTNFAISKCYIPQESTVVFLYCMGFAIIFLFAVVSFRLHFTGSDTGWCGAVMFGDKKTFGNDLTNTFIINRHLFNNLSPHRMTFDTFLCQQNGILKRRITYFALCQ